MLAKYTKWTNIWKILTPLDSSQLQKFLEFFWEFFIFWNSNLNFEFRPVWNRPEPEPVWFYRSDLTLLLPRGSISPFPSLVLGFGNRRQEVGAMSNELWVCPSSFPLPTLSIPRFNVLRFPLQFGWQRLPVQASPDRRLLRRQVLLPPPVRCE